MQFDAVQARHDDVGDQQLVAFALVDDAPQCVVHILGRLGAVATLAQDQCGQFAHGGLVFHHEDALARIVDGAGRATLPHMVGEHWQKDVKGCSHTLGAFDVDVALVLLDDAEYRGQSESRAVGRCRSRKERLEHVVDVVGRDPLTGVAQLQPDVVTGGCIAHRAWRVRQQTQRPQRKFERAAVGHRLSGVHRHGDDGLLQLCAVGTHRARFPGDVDVAGDVFGQRTAQQRTDTGQHLADVQAFQLQCLASGKSQQLPGQGGCSFGRAAHVAQQRLGRVGTELQRGQVHAPQDDCQQIVEVVGDAAGQTAD